MNEQRNIVHLLIAFNLLASFSFPDVLASMKYESIVQKRNNQLIQWDPPTSDKVDDSKVDLVSQPFKDDLELQIPENEEHGWNGKYEHSAYAAINGMEKAK
uniref:Uncharacterized protein n=1 Tax=Populus trichocarpa TaxID=3694 RepID=A0A2K1R4P9_POPTR